MTILYSVVYELWRHAQTLSSRLGIVLAIQTSDTSVSIIRLWCSLLVLLLSHAWVAAAGAYSEPFYLREVVDANSLSSWAMSRNIDNCVNWIAIGNEWKHSYDSALYCECSLCHDHWYACNHWRASDVILPKPSTHAPPLPRFERREATRFKSAVTPHWDRGVPR